MTNTTGPDWSHEIAFDADGDWSIGHPDGCPGQAGGDCDVQRLAFGQVDAGFFNRHAGRRYRCDVNDLRDRFLFGARIENEPAGLAPWDRYDNCGRCVLVAALGGPVRVTRADCPAHGINPTTQPEETTMTDTTTGPWYTISVVRHDQHPTLAGDNSSPPVEVIACTVLPHLAGDVLRATAEQIAPKKPAMRGSVRPVDEV